MQPDHRYASWPEFILLALWNYLGSSHYYRLTNILKLVFIMITMSRFYLLKLNEKLAQLIPSIYWILIESSNT
jgi:hypothetical protein